LFGVSGGSVAWLRHGGRGVADARHGVHYYSVEWRLSVRFIWGVLGVLPYTPNPVVMETRNWILVALTFALWVIARFMIS
jgi:hypothetical protein